VCSAPSNKLGDSAGDVLCLTGLETSIMCSQGALQSPGALGLFTGAPISRVEIVRCLAGGSSGIWSGSGLGLAFRLSGPYIYTRV